MRNLTLSTLLLITLWPCSSWPSLIHHSPRPLQAEASPESLIPWETPIDGFFIRSHHDVPLCDPRTWSVTIDGLVKKTIKLKLKELRKMKKRTLHAVLECSGNGRSMQSPPVPGVPWRRGAVGNAQWTGVPLADLLKKAGVSPRARFVRFEGADRPMMPGVPAFVRSVPIEKVMKGDSLIAFEMNREPLSLTHGGPARIILPGWYGENWIKWVTKITLTAEEDEGYYMRMAYRMPRQALRPLEHWDSATGAAIEEIAVQSLITEPIDNSETGTGTLTISGKAFSGAGNIRSVEVSANKGLTWHQAVVDAPRESGGWQTFHLELAIPEGEITLWSRATDTAGQVQPLEHMWNPGGYIRNSVDMITLRALSKTLTHGLDILKAKCQTCHAIELIGSQRLTEGQWKGVLKKMKMFGVSLSLEEESALTNYLLSPRSDTHYNKKGAPRSAS